MRSRRNSASRSPALRRRTSARRSADTSCGRADGAPRDRQDRRRRLGLSNTAFAATLLRHDIRIPHAHGLAFSVAPNVRTPPSLRNIFKEIATSLGHEPPPHGCLDTWAKQGVLLLNTVLTVERDSAASHAKRGWEKCTDTLIHEL